MVIVADTSPLNYLVLIGEVEVLRHLYEEVVIPTTVHSELTAAASPPLVRAWIERPPTWLQIHSVSVTSDASLDALDPGEREAILLADQLQIVDLLMDDFRGRREAERRGLAVTGTLGVLRDAAQDGLLDLRDAVARLQQTNFHFRPNLLKQLLDDQA